MIDPKVGIGTASPLSSRGQVSAKPEASAGRALSSAPSEDEIRSYAYQIYERRADSRDHAVEDWLTAEAHLTARKNRANKKLAS